jgi:hypothetical protein
VIVVADPAVVAAAPGLADDVRTDDLAVAGWQTDGVSATPDGGLTITIVHPFDTPEQATALLSTLNGPTGPLQSISIQRSSTIHELVFSVTGTGRLDGGLDAFTDTDLLAAVGGTPYADQIAASGTASLDALTVVLRVTVPGDASTSTGDVFPSAPAGSDDSGDDSSNGDAAVTRSVVTWNLALDGTDTIVDARSVRSLDRGGAWPLLATMLLVLLIGWVVLSLAAIVLVARKQRRRHRSLRRLERGLADMPYERALPDERGR